MKKKWHISRRKMLKGMGACIALPYLDVMANSSVLWDKPQQGPVRSAFMFMPNGVHPERWNPTKTGREFEFSPLLSPLKGFRDDILILGELMNKSALDDDADGHYARTANLLTSMPIVKTTGDDINVGGVSVDQVMANAVGNETLFPSLEYGLDRIKTGVDNNVGYTKQYASSISWKTPSQPMSKEIDPKLSFRRLFGDHVPGKQKKVDPWKASILDVVHDDAKDLRNNLGRSDQDKLDEYLESIRSVEKRIMNEDNKEKFEGNLTEDIKQELARLDQRVDEYVDMYAGIDVTQKTRLMMDIMALALWSDATRVITFMFGNSVSNRNFSFLDGVSGNHHSISHHMNNKEKMEEYAIIGEWHVQQYAYFLDKLRSFKEGDSNLLDQSMALFASGLRDGNKHAPHDLPVVLSGKGGGKLNTGQNLLFEKDTPLANLYVTMLQNMGVQAESFADSDRILTEILA
ncbi:MAG: DUF1552 domain-containing protein [Cyclobacteriaceae bacterium]